jgi:hypothetical protein
MRKFTLLALMLLMSIGTYAQVVFYGTQEFDKTKKDGPYTTLPIDKKYVEKGWRMKLAEFGKVIVTKDVYTATGAMIPAISEFPLNITSKIFTQKGRTGVFMSVNLKDSLYVTKDHPKYAVLEKILTDFGNTMAWEEEVRKQEDMYSETLKKQEKVIRQGEKIINNIESNKKDRDKLIRKQDENVKDHEQLIQDQETNSKEVRQAQAEFDTLKTKSPAEKELSAAQKKFEKAAKQKDKLSRKLIDNEGDRDTFPRKLDDNKSELDKLNIDLERNKQDQLRMVDEVAKALKAVNDVKAKKPSGN